MKASFRFTINLALGAGMVLLLALGVASHVTVQAFLNDAKLENALTDTVLRFERLTSQLKAAESGQRKYIITGAPADLQAYEASRGAALAALAESARDATDPGQRNLFDGLERAIVQRVERMDLAVRTRRSSGLEAASSLVGSELNRELQQTIDDLAARMKVTEVAKLQVARDLGRTGAEAISWRMPAAWVLSLLLFGWSIYLVNLYAEKRERARVRLTHSAGELRRASEALRASEGRLREIMDAVPALIAYADGGQRLRFHNRAYEESLGLLHHQIDGRTLREVLGDEFYESVRSRIEEAYAGYAVSYERSLRNAHGELRDYEMKYFPRYGEGAHEGEVVGVYALGNDVTEFRRVDRMKSEFVSTVSHELRTPLTSIRGSLGLIAGGAAGALPPKAVALVAIAKDNCERLIRLINDILDIETMESGKMRLQLQVQPLKPLLVAAVRANDAYAVQRDVGLQLDAPDDPIYANVDADRLIQVMTNLLSNAAKFSPAEAVVLVRLWCADGRAHVEVQDQGPGIPPEFRARIFQKFSQADASDTRQKGGSGLGLSISRALVEGMGGTLDFHCPPQGGSVFRFTLPLMAAPAAGPGSAGDGPRILVYAKDGNAARLLEATRMHGRTGDGGPGPRILHLDDDRDIQRITAAIAQNLATFVFASTPTEAREKLRSGAVDAVLLDLSLGAGEAPGSSLFGDIEALDPPPPVVIFSATEVSDADRRQAAAILMKSEASGVELREELLRAITQPAPLE